jgi:hypothetical protein
MHNYIPSFVEFVPRINSRLATQSWSQFHTLPLLHLPHHRSSLSVVAASFYRKLEFPHSGLKRPILALIELAKSADAHNMYDHPLTRY